MVEQDSPSNFSELDLQKAEYVFLKDGAGFNRSACFNAAYRKFDKFEYCACSDNDVIMLPRDWISSEHSAIAGDSECFTPKSVMVDMSEAQTALPSSRSPGRLAYPSTTSYR